MFQISCDSVSSNPGNLFILQVDDMRGTHVKTLQSSWPQFTLGELQSGTTYKVNVRNKSKLIKPTFKLWCTKHVQTCYLSCSWKFHTSVYVSQPICLKYSVGSRPMSNAQHPVYCSMLLKNRCNNILMIDGLIKF